MSVVTEASVPEWFHRNTWHESEWSAEQIVGLKGGRTISVVVPALNEESTIGGIVRSLVPQTQGPRPLVDEVVVVDSGSTDATLDVAFEAGAGVLEREGIVPGLPVQEGKSEVLWRGTLATTGDIVCFHDADLGEFSSGFVPNLIAPLLQRPSLQLVKGFYERAGEGGRVTELVARPLIAHCWPELAFVVQPLGGEYAATRAALESCEFSGGYGVDLGILLDVHSTYGLGAIGQVDLGVRRGRRHSLAALGRMAREVTASCLSRTSVGASATPVVQYEFGERWVPATAASVPPTRAKPVRERIADLGDGPTRP